MDRLSVVSTTSGLSLKGSDVVKRGSLFVKRPPTNSPVKLRIKTWQKRYLVLRDTWTDDGDTLLELYSNEAVASSDIILPVHRTSLNQYVINLRTVAYVDVYTDSNSFPNAFVVFRRGKSPLIFGAKSDLEMREWMMAIKLLADKVNHMSDTSRPSLPNGTSTHRTSVCPSRSELDLQSKAEAAHSSWNGSLSKRHDDQVRRSTPHLLMDASPETRNKRLVRQSKCSIDLDEDHHGSSPIDADTRRPSVSESRFLVSVQETNASADRQLEGEYVLVVGESDIMLRKPHSTRNILSWPMLHIRKLKSEGMQDGKGDLITLEASSYCGAAQGLFLFRIPSGWDLIKRVRLLAKKLDTDTSCRQQQRDIDKLRNMTSSSLDEFLSSRTSPSVPERKSPSLPERKLVEQRSRGQCKSQWDIGSTTTSVTTHSTSKMYNFTGNTYLAVVDDCATPQLPLQRQLAPSRSMGSLIPKLITRINTTTTTVSQRNDSGFESSSEEAGHHFKLTKEFRHQTHGPPQPPPRPQHTISPTEKH